MDFFLIKKKNNIAIFPRKKGLHAEWLSSDEDVHQKPFSIVKKLSETRMLTANGFALDFHLPKEKEQDTKICETVKRALGMGDLIHELNFKLTMFEVDDKGTILIKNRSYANKEQWGENHFLRGPGKMTVFERLCAVFGEENVKFHLVLRLAYLPVKDAVVNEKSLITLSADDFKTLPSTNRSAYISADFSIPSEMWHLWEQGSGYLYANVTFKVRLSGDAMRIVKLRMGGGKCLDLGRKLMGDNICTDLEIECRDGNVVKCNRAFLAVNSEVFRAMFVNKETKEAKEGRLVVVGMGEVSVKAMVSWIYCEEFGQDVWKTFEVVFELLEAGHRWDLKGLVEELSGLITRRNTRDEKWWTVGNALKLYMFTRNVDEMKEIRNKAAGVLKMYALDSVNKLVESVEYLDLFRSDPKTAIELTSLCLQLPSTPISQTAAQIN